MIKELFNYVLENYINEYDKASNNDPNFGVITHELPMALGTLIPLRTDIEITGSMGVGNKTDYPWVAIFNKRITTSATKGLYIVYLFKKDMSGFYISLNQGITYFKNTYNSKRYDYAMKVAKYFKEEIGDDYFSKNEIDLCSTKNSLGYGYAKTNIISKFYLKNSFTDEELINDLNKMLLIYDELVGVLAENEYNYNEVIKNIINEPEEVMQKADDAIEEINKIISNPTDVNVVRTLKYVEPKVRQNKKYDLIRNRAVIRKIDWLEKARSDIEIGMLGEKLALEYEKSRLIHEGLEKYANKVQRVSIKSDAMGYDIISYIRNVDKVEKIYIEVKTTTNKLDVPFQVSLNELKASNELDSKYCLFRIYDVKNPTPSFYKVYGKIEDNFKVDAITFMAKYKGKK